MNLLIDTCVFLWLIADDPQLSPLCRELFSDPANTVFLSAASAWEIAVKNSIGKLPLPVAAHRFVLEQRNRLRVLSLPLNEQAALQISKLPPLHRDPFDRILICQSIVEGFTLLTPDPLITQYPVQAVW